MEDQFVNTKLTPLALCGALVVAPLTTPLAIADTPADSPAAQELPRQFQMLINLGAAGLLGEMANFENLSVTQGRLGVSRAQEELSRAAGIDRGFEDTTSARVLPADALISLPSSGGTRFVRAGVIVADFDGDDGDLVEVDTALQRAELQYMVSPSLDSLYGLGVFYEKTEMDLVHMNGRIDRPGYGLRADALNKLSPHWGLATRLDLNWATNENTLPVGPATVLEYDLDDTRLYLQSDLVGTYDQRTLGWLPDAWIFRPALGLVYQNTEYDQVTTNLGSTATGTAGRHEEYAFASLSARFESTAIGPGKFAPHVEVGLETELKNDLDRLVDDGQIAHLDMGVATYLNRGLRMDLVYTAHRGSEGLRRDQGLTLHFGLAF